MKKNLPEISIIIPVKPGGFVKALEAIKSLEYADEKVEILVAEGRQPSKQRNVAANEARGEILYFLDDDSVVEAGNLQKIAAHFADQSVDVVGGPSLTPESDSFIQHCFSHIFKSPFGGAAIRNRYLKAGHVRETSEKELILCNLSFRKVTFNKNGGFDERLYPNEENELMARIGGEGGKLIHDPDLYVTRSHRKTLPAFINQNFNYGRGRMEETFLKPSSFSPLHFIPLLFLLYFLSLSFIDYSLYLLPIKLYVILMFVFSLSSSLAVNTSISQKIKTISMVVFLFPVMHLSYGVGMVWGAVKALIKNEKIESSVELRLVDRGDI